MEETSSGKVDGGEYARRLAALIERWVHSRNAFPDRFNPDFPQDVWNPQDVAELAALIEWSNSRSSVLPASRGPRELVRALIGGSIEDLSHTAASEEEIAKACLSVGPFSPRPAEFYACGAWTSPESYVEAVKAERRQARRNFEEMRANRRDVHFRPTISEEEAVLVWSEGRAG